MSATPQPPYLVIREGKSFWAEARPLGEISATLQAFEEGCFHDAWCYDATGSLWPIVTVTLKQERSLFDRLLPWKRVPVQLEFGAPTLIGVPDIVSRLAKVLESDNDFCEYLPRPAIDILHRFEEARTPSDIIRVARDYGERAA
jgi:hypothetical protein